MKLTGWSTKFSWLWIFFAIVVLGYALFFSKLGADFPADATKNISIYLIGLGLLSLLLAHLTKQTRVQSLVIIILFLQLLGVGFGPALAASFVALSALAIGLRFFRFEGEFGPWLSLVLGFAIIAGVEGWLLPYSVHRSGWYAILFFIPIVWQRHLLLDQLSRWFAPLRFQRPASSNLEFLTLLVIGLALSSAWIPTILSDDLAYHLGLPYQLQINGYYKMDVASQMWALAPWASDVLHALPQLLIAQEARGAVASIQYIALFALVWHALKQMQLPLIWACLGLLLFASLPMLHFVGSSMQTELLSALTVAAIVNLLLAFARNHSSLSTPKQNAWLAIAILFGFGMGQKISMAFTLFPLGIWTLVRWGRPSLKTLLYSIFLGVVIAGSSYVYAYIITQNPVYPTFNAVFKSPLIEAINIFDSRYAQAMPWNVLFDVLVNSNVYFESWKGISGAQWWLLALPLVLVVRDTKNRALALVGMIAVACTFLQVHYLRYIFPASVLLSIALPHALKALNHDRFSKFLVGIIVIFNLAYMSNVVWILRERPFGALLLNREAAHEKYFRKREATRLLHEYLRASEGKQFRALLPCAVSPMFAEGAGRAFHIGHYDWELGAKLQRAIESGKTENVLEVFRYSGANRLIVADTGCHPLIHQTITRFAQFVSRAGSHQLFRLEGVELSPHSQTIGVRSEKRFRLDTNDPKIIELQFALNCPANQGYFEVAFIAQNEQGIISKEIQTGICADSGLMHFKRHLGVSELASELVIEAHLATQPLQQDAFSDMQVHFYRDLPSIRDFSDRVKL